MLDLGAELRRFRRDQAGGFDALSAEWHNFVASIGGQRMPPAADPLPRLPETPRVDARAVDAYLRGAAAGAAAPPADARLREAASPSSNGRSRSRRIARRPTGSSGPRVC